MNIVLTEDAQALDEVVVIGYGTVKKRFDRCYLHCKCQND